MAFITSFYFFFAYFLSHSLSYSFTCRSGSSSVTVPVNEIGYASCCTDFILHRELRNVENTRSSIDPFRIFASSLDFVEPLKTRIHDSSDGESTNTFLSYFSSIKSISSERFSKFKNVNQTRNEKQVVQCKNRRKVKRRKSIAVDRFFA